LSFRTLFIFQIIKQEISLMYDLLCSLLKSLILHELDITLYEEQNYMRYINFFFAKNFEENTGEFVLIQINLSQSKYYLEC